MITGDRPDINDPGQVLNGLVLSVAKLLPFPVELDADMGYTGALFIDLGRRGGDEDPPDTASIDAEVQPVVWVFDVEGGRQTVVSGFGPTADPGEVARWIATEALRAQSPATRGLMRRPAADEAAPGER